MPTRMWVVAVALVLAGLALAGGAEAQADEAALLRHGVVLRQQGHDDEALVEFQHAYALNHSANAAGQMGLAEQALGRWLGAEHHVREALAATDDRWVTRNRATLDGAYAIIEQHVGQIEIRGGVTGAEVRINGESAGTMPLAAPIRALTGTVTLEVRAMGYYPELRRVEVVAGGMARESVELRVVTSEPSGGVSEQPASAQHGGIGLPHILAGIGVLGLVVGGVAWLWSALPSGHCSGFDGVTRTCDQGADGGVGVASWTAVVASGVGVVALGIGAVMLATSSRSEPRRVSWIVVPTPGGALSTVGVRF